MAADPPRRKHLRRRRHRSTAKDGSQTAFGREGAVKKLTRLGLRRCLS